MDHIPGDTWNITCLIVELPGSVVTGLLRSVRYLYSGRISRATVSNRQPMPAMSALVTGATCDGTRWLPPTAVGYARVGPLAPTAGAVYDGTGWP